MAALSAWDLLADGARLRVRVTPRGGRSALDGVGAFIDGRAAALVRLSAPPVEGAANAALTAFVADALDLPRRAVTLAQGAHSRDKTLTLTGDPATLATRLALWLAPQ